jgi:hypothetical protein
LIAWWQWWRRIIEERPDADAVTEQHAKLEQARAEDPWIASVGAEFVSQLPQDQLTERMRQAMTLQRKDRP